MVFPIVGLQRYADVAKIQSRRSTKATTNKKVPITGTGVPRDKRAPKIPASPSQRGKRRPLMATNPYTATPAKRTRRPNMATAPKPITAWATTTAAFLDAPPAAYGPESVSSVIDSPMTTVAVTTKPMIEKRVAVPVKRSSLPLKLLLSAVENVIAETNTSPRNASAAREEAREQC